MAVRVPDLYTFFVVARSGSMQGAARELGVTPGAISQRVRALEEGHGQRLFDRGRGGVALTPSGQALMQEVGAGFAEIEAARHRHFGRTNTRLLRISAPPSLAHSVLAGGLGSFTAAHPGVRVVLEAEDRLVDLRREPVDLAIRHGLGRYPGLRSEWLCAPELILVASPALLAAHPPVETPADCLNLPLLPLDDCLDPSLSDGVGRDWPLWFEAQGVDARAARYGPAFRDGYLTVKAAVGGQGVALVRDIHVREELADGRLVRLLDGSWPTRFGYYGVGLPDSFERPAVRGFVAWLRGVMGET